MKHKTPQTPIVENTFDKKLIKGFKKADSDSKALNAIYHYYILPIEAMLKKTTNDDLARKSAAMTFTKLLQRKEAIRNTRNLLTITFIKAKKICSDYLKDEPQEQREQMKQQLNDLQNIFFEIEYLQEKHRTIIKTCLQNEGRAAAAKQLKETLPSLSKLVKKAINGLVAKLHKKRKIQSLDIFNEIFLPLLLNKN